nr:MAG: polyprotein [Mite martelli-like virus]
MNIIRYSSHVLFSIVFHNFLFNSLFIMSFSFRYPITSVTPMYPGYCYLKFFRHINEYVDIAFLNTQKYDLSMPIDLSLVASHFGPYPQAKDVLLLIADLLTTDIYLPSAHPTFGEVLHVTTSQYSTFSYLLQKYMFTNHCFGSDEYDDCIARSQAAKQVALVAKMAGYSIDEAIKMVAKERFTTQIKEKDLATFLFQNKTHAMQRQNNRNIVIDENLSVVDQSQLSSTFPELTILFKPSLLNPHGFAAASRDLFRHTVRLMSGIDPLQPGIRSVNVGGDWMKTMTDGILNEHCCSPIYDYRDSARETQRKMRLDVMIETNKASRQRAALYRNNSPMRCSELSQKCTVPARQGYMFHSQYDINLRTVGEIIDAHGFEQLDSILWFDPVVLTRDSGSFCFGNVIFNKKKNPNTKRLMIHFSFIDDPSLNYIHDYSDYIMPFMKNALVTPTGRMVIIEKMSMRCSQMHIRYTTCLYKPINREIVLSSTIWSGSKDQMVVTTWDFDNKYYVDTTAACFKRRKIVCSKKLYGLIMEQCIRSDKDFSIQNIYSAGASFNSRMTINGSEVFLGENMDPVDLMYLVSAIYARSYDVKYSVGKVLEKYTNQQKKKRLSNSITICDFVCFIMHKIDFLGLFSQDVETSGFIRRQIEKLADIMGRWRGKFDIDFTADMMCSTYTVCEYMEVYANHTNEEVVDLYNETIDSVTLRMEDKNPIMEVEILGEKRNMTTYITPTSKSKPSSSKSPIVTLPSDSTKTSKTKSETPETIKSSSITSVTTMSTLLESESEDIFVCGKSLCSTETSYMDLPSLSKKKDFEEISVSSSASLSKAVRRKVINKYASQFSRSECKDTQRMLISVRSQIKTDRITCDVDSKVIKVPGDGYCGYSALIGASGLPISVEQLRVMMRALTTKKADPNLFTNDSPQCWADHSTILLFSRLTNVKVCMHFVTENCVFGTNCSYTEDFKGDERIHIRHTGDHYDYYDEEKPNMHNMVMSILEHIYANNSSRNRYYEYATITNINKYINRSAYKLLQIMNDMPGLINRDDNILDVGGAPGGFLQVLKSLDINVTSVSNSNIQYKIQHDKLHILNVTSETQLGEKFDVILCDIADNNTYKSNDLVDEAFTFILNHLKEGGNVLIKYGNVFDMPSRSYFSDVFQEIHYLKPYASAPANTEIYVVGKNYNNNDGTFIITPPNDENFFIALCRRFECFQDQSKSYVLPLRKQLEIVEEWERNVKGNLAVIEGTEELGDDLTLPSNINFPSDQTIVTKTLKRIPRIKQKNKFYSNAWFLTQKIRNRRKEIKKVGKDSFKVQSGFDKYVIESEAFGMVGISQSETSGIFDKKKKDKMIKSKKVSHIVLSKAQLFAESKYVQVRDVSCDSTGVIVTSHENRKMIKSKSVDVAVQTQYVQEIETTNVIKEIVNKSYYKKLLKNKLEEEVKKAHLKSIEKKKDAKGKEKQFVIKEAEKKVTSEENNVVRHENEKDEERKKPESFIDEGEEDEDGPEEEEDDESSDTLTVISSSVSSLVSECDSVKGKKSLIRKFFKSMSRKSSSRSSSLSSLIIPQETDSEEKVLSLMDMYQNMSSKTFMKIVLSKKRKISSNPLSISGCKDSRIDVTEIKYKIENWYRVFERMKNFSVIKSKCTTQDVENVLLNSSLIITFARIQNDNIHMSDTILDHYKIDFKNYNNLCAFKYGKICFDITPLVIFEVHKKTMDDLKAFFVMVHDYLKKSQRHFVIGFDIAERFCSDFSNLDVMDAFPNDCANELSLKFTFQRGYNSPIDNIRQAVASKIFPTISISEMTITKTPNFLNVTDDFHTYYNAMREYKFIINQTDDFVAKEYKDIINRITSTVMLSETTERFILERRMNIFSHKLNKYLFPCSKFYKHGYDGEKYVDYNSKENRFETDKNYVLVTDFTQLMLNKPLAEALDEIPERHRVPEIEYINGVPGCGKTTFLLSKVRTRLDGGNDLFLTTTREAVNDVRNRVKKGREEKDLEKILREDYRTVTSYLMNGTIENGKQRKYENVYYDEALMTHAGAIGYIASLSSCKRIVLLGDKYQIPYIDREHILHLQYSSPEVFIKETQNHTVTYRCPQDVAYALRPIYGEITSHSSVVASVRLDGYAGRLIEKRENTLYMVHLQADKDKLMREGYGDAKGSRVMTIHEAEGQTFENVVIIRSGVKPYPIYSSQPHAIVAISRHRKTMVYYTDAKDALSALIKKGNEGVASGAVSYRGGYTKTEVVTDRPSCKYCDDVKNKLANLPLVNHAPIRPKIIEDKILYPKTITEEVVVEKPDIYKLQQWYDMLVPGGGGPLYDDQLIIERSNLILAASKITLDLTKKTIPRQRKYEKLRPILRTLMPPPREESQTQSILGLLKRNDNVPHLNNNLSQKRLGELLFENFKRSFLNKNNESLHEQYKNDIVTLNPFSVDDWLKGHQPIVRQQIESDVPLHLKKYKDFSYMMKKNVKPPMTKSAINEFLSVQAIAYQGRDINAIFCPVIGEMRKRLVSLLDPRFMIFSDMSNEEFNEELNKRFDPNMLRKMKVLEGDFSKYDKSQEEALLEFEMLLYRSLGMDEELIQIWIRAHRESRLKDRRNGVKTRTKYQRKSGDATTFFGNTVVLMAVMAACYDMMKVYMGMFGGDDSFLFTEEQMADTSNTMADMFNLEFKLLHYDFPYFCSKFLIISSDGEIALIPDPLKAVTKLGRTDLMNKTHLEEYRISCADNYKIFKKIKFHFPLSMALSERYPSPILDHSHIFTTLASLAVNKEAFSSLFTLPSKIIHEKTTLSNLN